MFVVLIHYIKPLEEVDKFRQVHLDFIQEQINNGVILMAGRQIPAKGGLFIAKADSRVFLEKMMQRDPYTLNQVATFEVIEFNPAKVHPSCMQLIG